MRVAIQTGWLCALLLLWGCSGDYLPMAGGELKGQVTPAPDSWTETAADKIVQLETQPADPYSVNLWVLGQGATLNIFAGDSRTNWVEHIAEDPNVRLQIGERIYQLTAERVTDAAEFKIFADGWEAKYGNRPRNESVAETYLYRLVPRAS